MREMNNSDMPAMPIMDDMARPAHQERLYPEGCSGLTKREYAAIKAMQGLAANPNTRLDAKSNELLTSAYIAKQSLIITDALLDELDK